MKLVQWPLMGGLLHLVQRRPVYQSPYCCSAVPIEGLERQSQKAVPDRPIQPIVVLCKIKQIRLSQFMVTVNRKRSVIDIAFASVRLQSKELLLL